MKTLLAFVFLVGTLSAQTVVSLNGTPYTLVGHPRVWLDGPNGAATARLKDPDGAGPLVAPRADASNPAWIAANNFVNDWMGVYQQLGQDRNLNNGDVLLSAAMVWYSDNSKTSAHDMAVWMLNHFEWYMPLICAQAYEGCGQSGYGISNYGVTYWMMNWAQAYSIMRSELTPTERAAFVGKMLNDAAQWGGVNGSPTTTCTEPTMIPGGLTFTGDNSSGTVVITTNNAVFGTTIQVGDWVGNMNNFVFPARVASIISPTQATLGSSAAAYAWTMTTPAGLAYRSGTFHDGDCGFAWYAKSERFSPNVIIGYPNSPYTGDNGYAGMYGNDYGHNLVYTAYRGFISLFLAVADDDPNASVRAVPELSALYTGWLNVKAVALAQNTMYNQSGSGYGSGRAPVSVSTALMWNSSFVNLPTELGQWGHNIPQQYYMPMLPGIPNYYLSWGQQQVDGAGMGNLGVGELMMLVRAYAGTPESGYLQYWIRNIWTGQNYGFGYLAAGGYSGYNSGNFYRNGSVPPNIYLFNEPNAPQIDLANAPLQTAPGSQLGTQPLTVMMSRTGFKSLTDTLVAFYAMHLGVEPDHGTALNPGSYKIVKNMHLLSEDEPGDIRGSQGFNGYWQQSNYIQLGSDANIGDPWPTALTVWMPRKNVSDPTNRFAYAMADVTPAYFPSANAQRVYRHLIDFKKALTQQFVMVYDDIAVTSGETLKTFLHYANNGQPYEGVTTFDGVDSITSSFPGSGHSDATQLLTKVLSPGGANTVRTYLDNPDGSYTGGSGQTFRVTLCGSADGSTCSASNTSTEFLVVHEPVLGTGNAMPTVTSITSDANFRAAQVAGTSPKVALFARNGATYNSASFTSTHAGTAQIAVMGLTPGTYTVSGPSPTTGTVGADGLLYFEGLSGAYSLSGGGGVVIQSRVNFFGGVTMGGGVWIH